MDLSTNYMGLHLQNPIIVSATSATNKVSTIKKCADNGAGAVVLKSLFEEQILQEVEARLHEEDDKYFWYPEARDFVKSISTDKGVNEYLNLIHKTEQETSIPVIASINCVSEKAWPHFAQKIQDAGADALELNISIIPYDQNMYSETIERIYESIVSKVKEYINIPVAVKLPPYFTNIVRTATNLDKAGSDGLVIFNRFYRPDIDIDNLNINTTNYFSGPEEITQALRWVNLLYSKVSCDLAGNTGIHDYKGVIKHILSGAAAAELGTTLLKNGWGYIQTILNNMSNWMETHNLSSIDSFRGKMATSKNVTKEFERINFMKRTLQ